MIKHVDQYSSLVKTLRDSDSIGRALPLDMAANAIEELLRELAAANAQVFDLVTRITFIKGGDIPRTIEAARAALVLRCRELEQALPVVKPELLAALKDYVQSDEGGVFAAVSRQALDEAIKILSPFTKEKL